MKTSALRVALRYNAGLIDIPPKMLAEINRWVIRRFVASLMAVWQFEHASFSKKEVPEGHYFERKIEAVNLNWKYLQRFRVKPEPIKKLSKKRFAQNLQGWRYLSKIDPDLVPDSVLVVLRDIGQAAGGMWDSEKNVLTVKLPRPEHFNDLHALGENPRNFKRGLEQEIANIARTIRHELTHMAQSWLTAGLAKADPYVPADENKPLVPAPGLPSKHLMTPAFQQHLTRLGPRKKQRIAPRLKKIEEAGLLDKLHELDDIEFYSRLSDEVRDFKKQHRGRSRKELQKAFRFWVGDWKREHRAPGPWMLVQMNDPLRKSSDWFLVLRKHAPAKWRKAVKELAKHVL